MSGGDASDGEATRSMGAMPTAPAPVAADVGIVAAMSIEVGFLLDRLSSVRKYAGPQFSILEGELGGKVIALVITGMGRDAARRGAQLLIDGHRPRWIVSAGFGGALDPDLKLFDIVVADEVVDLESGRYAIDVGVPPPGPGARVRAGRLLTVDRIIRTAAEKAELRRRFEADVVDMETSGVAALCSERSIRFLSIRVVSDDAKVDLPPEIASMMTHSGSYRVGAALRAIWKRPSSLKDFWSLHEHAQQAADRLAGFTVEVIGKLD